MKKPDWMIHDKYKRSFKWWVKHYKEKGGEHKQVAEEAEATVPIVFAMFYPEYTINNIENMSFRDVQLKLAVLEKRLDAQNKTSPSSSKWSNSIVNTNIDRWM